ncbi:MAG TPA: SPOR domain-containing protein [Gammaproteobacteria bacterium]|nr:SPOR domain-containing protein [Gammaproteobacteria bacterium]
MSEYFHECHWGQCLELLSHLCEYSDSVLLVTGPEGIGKTALKRELISQESDQFAICAVDATSSLTAEQLTISIEQTDDRELLLLIDDAQNLALDVVAMIFQLKQKAGSDGRLHIVLFATEEFEQKVSHSVLKEEFAEHVHTIEIEPLTVAEVESFLMQQWRLQHHNTDMPLNRAKCKKIHAMSDGIPGKVKELAADILDGREARPREDHHTLSPFTVGITVSLGIVFCILALLWPAADKDIITKTASTEQTLPMADQEADKDTSDLAAQNVESVPTKVIDVSPPVAVEPAQLVEVHAAKAVTPKQAPVNTVSDSESVSPQNVDQKIALLEKKVTDLQNQLQVAEQKLQQLMGGKQVADAKPSKKVESSKKEVSKIEPGKKVELNKKAILQGKKATPHKPLANLAKQESKILRLPTSHYALQLISMHKEEQATSFIKMHKLQDKAHYFKGHFKGKDWFIVVYGDYATRVDAQKALSALPTSLKKLNPMAREYGNIHHAITSRGKHD